MIWQVGLALDSLQTNDTATTAKCMNQINEALKPQPESPIVSETDLENARLVFAKKRSTLESISKMDIFNKKSIT